MSKLTPLFARQPIFDQSLNVIGYELLFRNTQQNAANVIDGDHASSHVMHYAFGEHRPSEIIGDKKAFVNFTKNLLVCPPEIPPEQLIIEVLEDIHSDPQVLDALKNLRKKGYDIALDDFFINDSSLQFLKYAQIVKIDVLNVPKATVAQYIRKLRPMGIKLLAEKIETHEMMQECIKLGFHWFQGYFLSKPHIIQGVKVSGGVAALLQLLACLTADEIDINEVIKAIGSDPRISYKILKLVNASANGLNRKVESINQAVMLLGINQIRNWASLLLLASNEDKPEELCVLSSTRAKFCELIGNRIDNKKFADSCFAVGLLSTFDAFLDLPMQEVLSNLNLSDDMQVALLQNKGKLGHVLALTLHLERSNWATIQPILAFYKISENTVAQLYIDAISWATAIHKQLH